MRAVVFAHRAPCAFAEVGSPTLPVLLARTGFSQSNFLLCHENIGISNQASLRNNLARNLQIAAPGAESGVVHRVVDA